MGRGVYGGGAAKPGRELVVASGVVAAEGYVEPLIYSRGDTGRREGADGWRSGSSAAPSMVWGWFGGAEATLGGGL